MNMLRNLRVVAAVSAAVGVALTVASPTDAQTSSSGRPLAIEDFYQLRTVGTPELSPDGRWVAYTVSTRVEATNGTISEVWLAAAGKMGATRKVSSLGASATTPSWANDGTLRFVVGAQTLRVDPAQPERVDTVSATPNTRGARPMLSPDGKWTATVRDVVTPKRVRVWASEFEKRHDERFKGVQFDWMDFHRDGAAFPTPNVRDPEVSPPQEIYLAPGAGGEARALTAVGLRPTGVQWKRDGSGLLFSADSTYRNERVYGRTDAWTVSTSGQLRRLTPNNDYDYNGAQLSPDGQWVLCTRQLTTDVVIARKLDYGGATDLVVMPVDGGKEIVLTADWDYLPANAVWSPDSKTVYFTGGVGGTQHLYAVSLDLKGVRAITTGQRRVSGVNFDRAFTRMAYLVGRFEAPSEIWLADIDGSHEVQVTQVHAPLVSTLDRRSATMTQEPRLRRRSWHHRRSWRG